MQAVDGLRGPSGEPSLFRRIQLNHTATVRPLTRVWQTTRRRPGSALDNLGRILPEGSDRARWRDAADASRPRSPGCLRRQRMTSSAVSRSGSSLSARTRPAESPARRGQAGRVLPTRAGSWWLSGSAPESDRLLRLTIRAGRCWLRWLCGQGVDLAASRVAGQRIRPRARQAPAPPVHPKAQVLQTGPCAVSDRGCGFAPFAQVEAEAGAGRRVAQVDLLPLSRLWRWGRVRTVAGAGSRRG